MRKPHENPTKIKLFVEKFFEKKAKTIQMLFTFPRVTVLDRVCEHSDAIMHRNYGITIKNQLFDEKFLKMRET